MYDSYGPPGAVFHDDSNGAGLIPVRALDEEIWGFLPKVEVDWSDKKVDWSNQK